MKKMQMPSEDKCERICRNIAVAFDEPALHFSENKEWYSISFTPNGFNIGFCYGLVSKLDKQDMPFTSLLANVCESCKLIGNGIQDKKKPSVALRSRWYSFEDIDFEEMLIRLDLHNV